MKLENIENWGKVSEEKSSKYKEGDIIKANDGQTDFIAEVSYVEDGIVYFNSGDDEYYFDEKDGKATKFKGNVWSITKWEN